MRFARTETGGLINLVDLSRVRIITDPGGKTYHGRANFISGTEAMNITHSYETITEVMAVLKPFYQVLEAIVWPL